MAQKPIFRTNPEAALQQRIITMLRDRGWFVRSSHGNAFQKGWPDLYCHNPSFERVQFGATRWIDVKVEKQHKFTKAQCLEWPEWMPEAGGPGVWILMGDSDEWYSKLFEPPNMWEYWRPAYDKYRVPVDEILKELE